MLAAAFGAVHAAAAAQATADGKALNVLTLIGDDVAAGYGDYTENTGPIHVKSVPLAAPLGAWAEHVTADTEELFGYRQLTDGRVIAPHVDPRGASGGYAELVDGAWADHDDSMGAEHVFDAYDFGGRLWLCGSWEDHAIVWESTDGGDTWSESLRHSHVDGFARFYVLAEVDGALYVKSLPDDVTYEWTVAGGWVVSESVLLPRYQQGGPGVSWRDGFLIPSAGPSGARTRALYFFDGEASHQISTGDLAGFSVADDGSLYVLNSARQLWRIAAAGPLTGTLVGLVEQVGSESNCALCVLPGRQIALVGTSQSRLKAVTLP